jgi:hypothetical protein
MPDPTRPSLHLAAALLFAAASLPAPAQTGLKIPQDAGAMQKLIEEPTDADCTRCGVVVSAMTGLSAAPRNPQRPNLARNPTLMGGPGGQLGTVPIVGAGGAAKQYREPDGPISVWVVVVQLDDGRLERIEQETDPRVRKGDRVRVTDRGVELQ